MVSESDVARFFEDGAICLRGVFTHQWLDIIAAGIKKNQESPSRFAESLRAKPGDGAYFNDYCNWQQIEEFRSVVFESPAAEVACKLMRSSKSAFYHEHVLTKEPGTSKETPWHHDQSYYPVDGEHICSMWIPVDPVTAVEGNISFVKGSHRWGKLFRPRKFATSENYVLHSGEDSSKTNLVFEDVPVAAIESGQWPLLHWDCAPGDVIVFHGKTLHGARGNASSTRHRRVLSLRWVGDDAVVADRPWDASPPLMADLRPGQHLWHAPDTFPVVYTNGS